jgi:16S rRNA C967 or C1407 C5-methylase (RsmB/RsmF family)/NOL1/NOP2/fmu family ribosome biogenesis protein
MISPLPPVFCARVASDPFLGKELLSALDMVSPVSIRMNPGKTAVDLDVKAPVSWCKHGYYLNSRPIFTLDPLFHVGAYYPQEAGSMLLDHVLRSLDLPDEPIILDLCAAPGGKSTLISSFLNGKGMLVANEVIPMRAKILRENLVKWGVTNTIVSNNKPSDFKRLPHFFDVLVADAPCSGEGMFRKDKESRIEWSESNVHICARRQQTILLEAWEALRPGGYLIYSTCTFNRLENEDNVIWMMEEFGATMVPFEVPEPLISDREGLGVYCLPGMTDSEGFYLAVLQKPDEKVRQPNFLSGLKVFHDASSIKHWLSKENYSFFQREQWIYALPDSCAKEMLFVQTVLHILKLGVTIGFIARKGVVPSEELALALGFCSTETPSISVTREQALNYLRGDTFFIEGEEGWNLLSYENENIGWIKKIGNRFNNHYPKEWRIRMRIDL